VPPDPGDSSTGDADTPMRLSIVIAARNAGPLIGEQLDALARQQPDPGVVESWEVIVADNGSTDDTRAVVERRLATFAQLRLVDASHGVGSGFARNRAVETATGTHVAIVDADDVVADGWMEAMGRALAEHPVVAGCLEYARLNEGLAATQPATTGLYKSEGFLPHAGSGNLGFEIGLYRQLGGFDERFVNAGNDVDLTWRVQLAGHDIWFAPDAVVHVRERSSLRASFRQFRAFGAQEPRLYKMYREHGMRRPATKAALARFAMLLLSAPRAWSKPASRLSWVKRFGFRAGCLIGSVRYRIWYLR
jgi:glycosyltransferase involved in cell wall biosynthesis